ncbi:MAG: hypothetical protein V3U88_09940 [Methylococcales bacterium]
MGRSILVISALLLSFFRFNMAVAEVHEVTLQNFSFSPNDITIQVGDTVRFNNVQGPHSVTADDQSFSRPEANAPWTFEQTFNEEGVALVYCTVHSSPGQNIANSMNARINVQAAVEKSTFIINPGLNGSWLNPATNGQGFFIDVFPNNQTVFLAWFTYDTTQPSDNASVTVGNPGHRWLTAQGSFEGNTATLDVVLSTAGSFDSTDPVTNSAAGSYGAMTLTFQDCNTGTVDYDFFSIGLSGSVPITRIVADNVPLCNELNNTAR